MKKIVLFLIAILFLSCSPYIDQDVDKDFKIKNNEICYTYEVSTYIWTSDFDGDIVWSDHEYNLTDNEVSAVKIEQMQKAQKVLDQIKNHENIKCCE